MGPEARAIDANANRAREALRVMEDLARFVLDHTELAADLKALRHALRAAIEGLGIDAIAWRDADGDVGASLTTDSERSRANVREVAGAAGARLAEALRSLEEFGKLVDPTSQGFKPLRYRGYELERRLLAAFGSGRARQWRLCVLLSEPLCARPWDVVVERAIEGGADAIQLREKSIADRALVARARRLVEITRRAGVASIINDRPEIALLAGADAVHVGQQDLAVEDARRIVGSRLLIGVSTGALAEAREAVLAGADVCGVGPMFPSATKPKPVRGIAYLREYLADAATTRVPHLAIGGITPENAGRVRDAGARGVAVSGAVCGASDPRQAAEDLRKAMDGP